MGVGERRGELVGPGLLAGVLLTARREVLVGSEKLRRQGLRFDADALGVRTDVFQFGVHAFDLAVGLAEPLAAVGELSS